MGRLGACSWHMGHHDHARMLPNLALVEVGQASNHVHSNVLAFAVPLQAPALVIRHGCAQVSTLQEECLLMDTNLFKTSSPFTFGDTSTFPVTRQDFLQLTLFCTLEGVWSWTCTKSAV